MEVEKSLNYFELTGSEFMFQQHPGPIFVDADIQKSIGRQRLDSGLSSLLSRLLDQLFAEVTSQAEEDSPEEDSVRRLLCGGGDSRKVLHDHGIILDLVPDRKYGELRPLRRIAPRHIFLAQDLLLSRENLAHEGFRALVERRQE